MTNKVIYKLKGHEKFPLREGWINKGLSVAKEKGTHIFLESQGPDMLGVGTNMVKSIRYWMQACGLLVKDGNKEILSDMAEIIYMNDPYLEDIFSLWILHSNITKNIEQATVWYMFFNRFNVDSFNKADMQKKMQQELFNYVGQQVTESSLKDDIDVLLNMYSKGDNKNEDPEDKIISPFSTLGIIKKEDETYYKIQPDLRRIANELVLYEISSLLDHNKSISIETIASGERSLGAIYNMTNLIVENKTKVYEFINNHFIWLTEYGTRLTIRSMTEQLAYMITGGMSCEEVTNNDAYKYLFSNLFFGYIGTKLNARALNIIAIAAANKCMYDHKRLRSDEKLLVGKEYKDMFGNAIKEIITDAEKNNAFIGGWTEFLRRTYLFTNIITDDVVISQDYEDVFSKQFKRYLVLRDGIDTPSKKDANLIADALSMIYIGTPSDGTEIPLTLSRESGITQNVQLITGTIPVRKLRVKSIKTKDSTFNKGKDRYELRLEIDRTSLDTILTLPMLDYFEELKNGVIATNIDPQLSHGVESLKTQISELLEEDEDENVIEIVALKNSGNDNIRLELTGDGKIREV